MNSTTAPNLDCLEQESSDLAQDFQFTYRPIGIVRSPYARRIDAPHQSTVVEGTETRDFAQATLELQDWLDEKVVQDLNGFERLWLIFAFHLSEGWRSSVKPPRGGPKRGVLATRSPHRPNSIGLSAVELVKIEGRTLHLRGVDLLDGTPVLDIKPYVPYADAFPDAKAGWIDELDAKVGRYFAPGPRKPREIPLPHPAPPPAFAKASSSAKATADKSAGRLEGEGELDISKEVTHGGNN